MRILLFDIESFANLVYAWSTRKVYVQPKQIVRPQKVVCWSAKWYQEPTIYFDSIQSGPKAFIHNLHRLMSQADAVVGYNENRFDIPMMNTEFLKLGLTPPAPFKQLDLYRTVRNRFALPSYKLEYVVKAFGIGEKMDSGGQELWNQCEDGDEDAWKRMETYNKHDTRLLEPLYEILKPWIKNHLHASVFHTEDGKLHCDTCGSTSLRSNGWRPHNLGKYKRLRCLDCGTWNRQMITRNNGPQTRGIHAT